MGGAVAGGAGAGAAVGPDPTHVVLGWDLARGIRWVPPYEQALAGVELEGHATTTYRIDGRDVPAPGTTVHLMLQGATRGLIGHGTVRSAPYLSAYPGQPGRSATYVLIEWDRLLPVADRILPEELAARVPDVAWREVYRPVQALSDADAHRLERVWAAPHPSARAPRARRRVAVVEAQLLSSATSAAAAAAHTATSAVSAVVSSVRHAHLPAWHPHLPTFHGHSRQEGCG